LEIQEGNLRPAGSVGNSPCENLRGSLSYKKTMLLYAKTAQNPTKSGTKKRHNLDLPFFCAVFLPETGLFKWLVGQAFFVFFVQNSRFLPPILGFLPNFGSKNSKNLKF
jgi:hypothetical protein